MIIALLLFTFPLPAQARKRASAQARKRASAQAGSGGKEACGAVHTAPDYIFRAKGEGCIYLHIKKGTRLRISKDKLGRIE